MQNGNYPDIKKYTDGLKIVAERSGSDKTNEWLIGVKVMRRKAKRHVPGDIRKCMPLA